MDETTESSTSSDSSSSDSDSEDSSSSTSSTSSDVSTTHLSETEVANLVDRCVVGTGTYSLRKLMIFIKVTYFRFGTVHYTISTELQSFVSFGSLIFPLQTSKRHC